MIAPEIILQDRYRILAKVGGGGMGTVYQVEDLRLPGHLCALKSFSPANLPQEDRTWALTYFRQEAEILATLNHPGLARVSNFFNEGEMWFLVMDWVDGQTLSDHLRSAGGRLAQQDGIAIVDQLCDVLEYLHNQQPAVIFRDLKPSNIMVTHQGQVKLIDFGTARFFKPEQNRDTVNLGTPGYAAPEQYGGVGQSDTRADIYSLGVVLHEVLTGYNPTITPFRLPPLKSLNPIASQYLESIIQKATSMEINDRFQTIADFRNALHKPEIGTAPLGQLSPNTFTPAHEEFLAHTFTPSEQIPDPTYTPPPAPLPPNTYTPPPAKKKQVPVWLIIGVFAAGLVICSTGAFLIWRIMSQDNVQPTLEWIPTSTPIAIEVTPTDKPPDSPTLTPTTETAILPTPTVDFDGLEQNLLNTIEYRPDNGAVIFAYHTTTTPLIDGNLDEWSSTGYTIPYKVYDPDSEWTDSDDLAADFQISWDANHLYLAVYVTDDIHVQNETGDAIFNGDEVELQIDVDLAGDYTIDTLNGDDGQLGLSPGNLQNINPESYIWLPAARKGSDTGIAVAASKTTIGYIIESAIPWSALGKRPANEIPVGFCINISDNDNISSNSQQVMISTSPNREWGNPQTWGTLILVNW